MYGSINIEQISTNEVKKKKKYQNTGEDAPF